MEKYQPHHRLDDFLRNFAQGASVVVSAIAASLEWPSFFPRRHL
jgi:hypothetical protein